MARETADTAMRMRLLLQGRESLYAYILACVRSFADADDILQNVSLVILSADDAPHEEGPFLAWAREIARRRVLEHFRRSKRLLPVDPQIAARLAEAAGRVEAQRAGSRQREALLECLESLPPESQQIVQARYDGSCDDVAAVARRFGRSEQGVYSLLYRIRNALRDCVERRLATEASR